MTTFVIFLSIFLFWIGLSIAVGMHGRGETSRSVARPRHTRPTSTKSRFSRPYQSATF